ncbi:unnamed protein product, partial [Mesorhabditis spiculigera]
MTEPTYATAGYIVPPPPCEGFLCYYESGQDYFASSVFWKLIISLSIISGIILIICIVMIVTNCKRKSKPTKVEVEITERTVRRHKPRA